MRDFRAIERTLHEFLTSSGVRPRAMNGEFYLVMLKPLLVEKCGGASGAGGSTILELHVDREANAEIISVSNLARELAEALT
jgi:hypothetical protein